jgi:FAD/FMN-containing dehydrogenase
MSTQDIAWDYSWDNSADDELLYELAQSAREQLDEYARSTGAYNEYIYLNYAGRTQDPLRGYGLENLEFLRRVSEKFDPDGVFQRLVRGGFKIDRA